MFCCIYQKYFKLAFITEKTMLNKVNKREYYNSKTEIKQLEQQLKLYLMHLMQLLINLAELFST